MRSREVVPFPYLAFDEMHHDWANFVNMLSVCDAVTALGLDAELFLYPPKDSSIPTGDELQRRYGLRSVPQVRWIPDDANRWVARARLLMEASRASRNSACAYTRRALPALGALLGGSPHVFLEFHGWIGARHDRVAFSIARRSRRLHIVCISRALAELVARLYHLDEAAIIVEHSGHSFPVRDDYQPGSNRRRLRAMYVGTFAPGRGLEMILDLAAHHPAIDFLIVGGPTPPQRLPTNLATRGWVDHAQVPALLAEADVLLMPYTRSAMLPDGIVGTAEFCSPLKMFEYLSAGRSIIASDLPSISEVLVDGSNCLLVESDSLAQWSQALERLERDPSLRARLAHAAAKTASHYTIHGRMQRILRQVGVLQ